MKRQASIVSFFNKKQKTSVTGTGNAWNAGGIEGNETGVLVSGKEVRNQYNYSIFYHRSVIISSWQAYFYDVMIVSEYKNSIQITIKNMFLIRHLKNIWASYDFYCHTVHSYYRGLIYFFF